MVELTQHQRLVLAYQATFGTGDGVKVLADLFEFCGLFDSCFHGEETRITAFMLGARSVALRIREMMSEEIGKEEPDATAES